MEHNSGKLDCHYWTVEERGGIGTLNDHRKETGINQY